MATLQRFKFLTTQCGVAAQSPTRSPSPRSSPLVQLRRKKTTLMMLLSLGSSSRGEQQPLIYHNKDISGRKLRDLFVSSSSIEEKEDDEEVESEKERRKGKSKEEVLAAMAARLNAATSSQCESTDAVPVWFGFSKRLLHRAWRPKLDTIPEFGTAYKAVLEDGKEVAVKRLKDAVTVARKKKFEQQMEVLGRLRHANLVSLKAYYFAREEKLLVYEYMPNGSLFWLLHGNRGPGRTPLDWTTRLKIAAGAARGVVFIHNSCKTMKLTHGDIKSTNVLLDGTGNARVSDFGLSIFPPAQIVAKCNGYRAPEVVNGRKHTQKSDVYSFGVLLQEILTGLCPNLVETGHSGGVVDLPKWVQSVLREEWTAEVFDLELMRYKDIEEEMVGLLQIAMACTAVTSDNRPKMGHVVKMIEDIRCGGGSETSPCQDGINSAVDSPCLSEDTCGGTTSQ